MRVYKYIHSCLLIEEGEDRILFDPGKFSFVEGLVKPDLFRDLSAMILTHRHPDHIDDNSLKKILKNNPSATVLTNSEIHSRLTDMGISSEVFETGGRTVGGFTLQATKAEHAQILNAKIPRNTAYVVNDTLLHPGDSFDHSLDGYKGITLLALPIMAPWTTELEVAEFARRLSPRQVIPIHDGYAKDFFLEQRYENFQKYFSQFDIEFQRLDKPGDFFDVDSRYS
jgi:L-ascorbate metabolism protein UlaG (beta-lactamase superfamily)